MKNPNTFEILTDYAKSVNETVCSCNIYNPRNRNGMTTHTLRHKHNNYQIEIQSATQFFAIVCYVDDLALVFAVNRPDPVLALNEPLIIAKSSLNYYSSGDFISKELTNFLAKSGIISLIESLNFSSGEALFVGPNRVEFVIDSTTRNISSAINLLINIVDKLPRSPNKKYKKDVTFIDGLELNVQKLPQDLRVLAPYILKYSIADDTKRDEILEKLSAKEKSEILQFVSSRIKIINDYLNSFGKDPLPDEAILVGHLAEAVTEMKLITDRSDMSPFDLSEDKIPLKWFESD